MNTSICPVLEFRWWYLPDQKKLQFGALRNYPKANTIPVSDETAELLGESNSKATLEELLNKYPAAKKEVEKLLSDGVLVDAQKRKKQPSPEQKQTCKKCVNDNYYLPGLEFNDSGICAFCQTYDSAKIDQLDTLFFGNVVQLQDVAAKVRDSGPYYDLMIGFTGGKDSAFLLWYLVKKLGLRVLAVTWELPFISDNAQANQIAARQSLPNVEFIHVALPVEVTSAIMRRTIDQNGYPCACGLIFPILAYAVAYENKVKYMLTGVEDAQVAHFHRVMGDAPNFAETTESERAVSRLEVSAAWVRSFAEEWGLAGKRFLDFVEEAKKTPERVPRVLRISSGESYGSWANVAEILEKEMGWQRPPGQEGLLHTSCKIEKFKDYIETVLSKEGPVFPQHLVQISHAVYAGLITREEGLKEISERAFNLEPRDIEYLREELQITPEVMSQYTKYLPRFFRQES